MVKKKVMSDDAAEQAHKARLVKKRGSCEVGAEAVGDFTKWQIYENKIDDTMFYDCSRQATRSGSQNSKGVPQLRNKSWVNVVCKDELRRKCAKQAGSSEALVKLQDVSEEIKAETVYSVLKQNLELAVATNNTTKSYKENVKKVCKTWFGKAMFKAGKDEMEFHIFSRSWSKRLRKS